MQTVQDTRRQRLGMLKEKYGRWVDLNAAIGWESTNARLSQIHSGTLRSDRGTPYTMGDDTAREIEKKLDLPATGNAPARTIFTQTCPLDIDNMYPMDK